MNGYCHSECYYRNQPFKVKCYLKQSGSILDIGGMHAYFGGQFLMKRVFCLLAPPEQMSFLTISNKNISFKTEGNRLSAIVVPKKCL